MKRYRHSAISSYCFHFLPSLLRVQNRDHFHEHESKIPSRRLKHVKFRNHAALEHHCGPKYCPNDVFSILHLMRKKGAYPYSLNVTMNNFDLCGMHYRTLSLTTDTYLELTYSVADQEKCNMSWELVSLGSNGVRRRTLLNVAAAKKIALSHPRDE